jgi:uncharacterized protein YndB with AHSA1/START domain
MALESIQVSAVIPATPLDVYEAWLDGGRHGAMTGGNATVEPQVGGRHTAWDGYIEGRTLELDPGRRIVQSWRSLDFPVGAGDSRLEISLRAVDGGTELTILHSEIPEGQGVEYELGWIEHYFRPMAEYFSGRESEFLQERTQVSLPPLLSESVGAADPVSELAVLDGYAAAAPSNVDTQPGRATTHDDRTANGVGELRVIPEDARFTTELTPVERPSARPRVTLKKRVATSAKTKSKVTAKARSKAKATAKVAKSGAKAAKKRPATNSKKKQAAKRKAAPKKPAKKPTRKAKKRRAKRARR